MKYDRYQRVEIKNTSKVVTIIDFEIFDDLILYYTDNKSSYPEDDLNPEGYNFFKNFVLTTNDEKNKIMKKAIKKHFKKH